MNSPASQKLAVSSTVIEYTMSDIKKAVQPARSFNFLYSKEGL